MSWDKVATAPLETRMRWYAELNRWNTPEDFPIELPTFDGDHARQHKDPEWRAAFNEVSRTLTDEEASLGWWKYALERTEDEWLAWWKKRARVAT